MHETMWLAFYSVPRITVLGKHFLFKNKRNQGELTKSDEGLLAGIVPSIYKAIPPNFEKIRLPDLEKRLWSIFRSTHLRLDGRSRQLVREQNRTSNRC